MPHPIHFHQSAELLQIILAGNLPADSQMDHYFRAHPNMGVRDRGLVAETVYGCLRERRVLEAMAGDAPATTPELIVATYLIAQGLSGRALENAGLRADIPGLVERVRTLDKSTLPFAVRANLPDWLIERLLEQFNEDETLKLAQSLNRPAPVDLRVNTLKAKREEVQAQLAAEGFETTPTPYSSVGLRRAERAPMFRTKAFKEGLFEVQDEGSQLLSLLVEPARREMVVDFCAGAGGKTLHLAALMHNLGTLYALDTSTKRLERLKPRLQRAKVHNVRSIAIAHERDDRVQRLSGKIDRVLVDAPCTGLGTLRRNPDIKWRTFDFEKLIAEQQRILAAAADLVKPGGRLVYATCSLLRAENDAVVDDFLKMHAGFEPIDVREILARRHVPPIGDEPRLRLTPARHGTDGFFAAVLERRV
jgi:16S rRNA (cytosine967-C5)-methyltransferase